MKVERENEKEASKSTEARQDRELGIAKISRLSRVIDRDHFLTIKLVKKTMIRCLTESIS